MLQLLEMAGNNELDRPLLGLLDENIAAAAATNNQVGTFFLEDNFYVLSPYAWSICTS